MTNSKARRAPSDPVTPQNIDAERAVLGAIMIRNSMLAEVSDLLTRDHFFREAHGELYAVFQSLDAKSKPIDLLTVSEELTRAGRLEAMGGLGYIGSLVNGVPMSTNVRAYAELVREAWMRRELVIMATALVNDAPIDDDPGAVVDRAMERLVALRDTNTATGPIPFSQLVSRKADAIERGDSGEGLSMGIGRLTSMVRGIRPGELVVLGGRTRMGKTAFMLNVMTAVARSGANSLMFSLEMDEQDLLDRVISSISTVPLTSVQENRFTDDELSKIGAAMSEISDWRGTVDPTPIVTVPMIRARCLQQRQRGGLDVVFIDYVQLIESAERRGGSRTEELGKMSRGLKLLAKALKVPFVILAQLSRNAEADGLPQLSDLRESGALEQDADKVIFIHRRFEITGEPEDRDWASIVIAKNRGGRTGVLGGVRWDGDTQRFFDPRDEYILRATAARREAERSPLLAQADGERDTA